MHGVRLGPRRANLPAALVALAVGLVLSAGALAQAPAGLQPLASADPPPNALLADAPDRIALTFAQPIDPDAISVRLLGAGDAEVALGEPMLDAATSTRVTAQPIGALGTGDYTVLWSARARSNGELFSGAYAFRAGVVRNPGAAELDTDWPAPWAVLLRWIVFLGTALAAGGLAWARLIAPAPGARASGSLPRGGTMALGALLALLATLAPPLLELLTRGAGDPARTLTDMLRAMPLGWWVQLGALVFLTLLCLGALASGRAVTGLPAALDWVGLAAGLTALAGLSYTSHAAATLDRAALVVEFVHQWTTALWVSGLLYLAAGWRDLGTDVARFRAVRWNGGLLIAISVATGLAAAARLFASAEALLSSRYGQVLTGKTLVVLAILALGFLAMVMPRRSNAVLASGSLTMQGALAALTVLLAALLALMAAPGAVAPVTLAGVDLADVSPLDTATFPAGAGTIHLLTQPAAPGAQTLAVRLTGDDGAPLAADPPPRVEVHWSPLSAALDMSEIAELQPDSSGSLFTGGVILPEPAWWQAEVVVTPSGGIASRARFWLVLPDPNVTGGGPRPVSDAEARALFERGLTSLTSLQSVRVTRVLNDGSGRLVRSRTAVRAAAGDAPAAYAETVVDPGGNVLTQQTIVGDRRWILAREDGWTAAEPMPLLTPAEWGMSYAGATGFQLGPLEEVDGEICRVVTFWQPPGTSSARAPAWFAWWVGLASGEVRREATVSSRQYVVSAFSDFDAPLDIAPPVTPTSSAATLAPGATPVATPTR